MEKELEIKGMGLTKKNDLFIQQTQDIKLPRQVNLMYGCMNCEWRSTPLCPFGFKKGKGHDNKKNMHTNGICPFRRAYFKSFIRNGRKAVTFATFQRDYNQGLAQIQANSDFQKLRDIEDKLDGIDRTDSNYKDLNKERSVLRDQWLGITNMILKFEDKQLDREQPKELHITQNNISPSEFQNMIQGIKESDIIDAEYEDITGWDE